MAHITISYERALTDGNYGKEGLLVEISEDVPSLEDSSDTIGKMVVHVRSVVLTTLACSASNTVAAAARREAEQHGIPLPPRTTTARGQLRPVSRP